MKLYLKRFILPEMENKPSYPYGLLASKQMNELVFDPITIFYGSNGSGKSTLLNIIARKLNICMNDKGNDAESLQPFIDTVNMKSQHLLTNTVIYQKKAALSAARM